MALPTGTISLSQVNVELNRNATATINLNNADVRLVAGKATGVVTLNDLRGKFFTFRFTIASNLTNANLRTLAVNAGWDQQKPVVATINNGVTISGSAQANSTAALTINGTWPRGIELVNNGAIQGRGGNGGPSRVGGSAGGRALLVSTPVRIRNNGAIRGGGGGGGGGGFIHQSYNSPDSYTQFIREGGGGGGGRSGLINSAGGASGPAGSPVALNFSGGSGAAGTLPSAGVGGPGDSRSDGPIPSNSFYRKSGFGGTGGNFGAGGATGQPAVIFTPANPAVPLSSSSNGGGGGGAGQAISGNPSITFLATGTRTGPIV